jgi:predicted DNA binding protein
MDEVLLRMEHELPFNNVSKRFPEARIYRWCNSKVDYLEFLSPDEGLLDDMRTGLGKVIAALRSHLLYTSRETGRLGVLVRCRCTPTNSTVRITEAANCLWKAPVVYEGGRESLTILAMTPQAFRSVYRQLEKIGNVEIVKKSPAASDVLRDSYTLSLSGLFGALTKRQIGLLAEATDDGYFDIPKRTSLDRLATKKSIGESTMQEHLSKAESKLLRALGPYLHLYASSL